MAPEQTREEAVLKAVLRLSDPAERPAFLEEACGGNAELRAGVEALLKAHEQAGVLEEPVLGERITLDTGPLTEKPGTVIGRYKLLEQIGEGGMGVVFMAEQQEPVRRRVALKIIKIGMDTKQVIARFEAERQALALMDHPNIARILDAGSTRTGRPYFVMELVKGVPITEYCDKNKLPAGERLDLFLDVCGAVQHAHQKGIIHRDIKPRNVMITLHDGKPVPKIIDFGIAKATNQRLTEKTLFTGYAQMIGTPAYMSPEQAEMSGLDVDTRTDIYSLGALLYELLTGITPFGPKKLHTAAYAEIQRIIREEEPVKPSTRVSTLGADAQKIASCRHTDPASLHKLCRGDVDWIVMKTLEKDRTRRYPTAAALADDIERHLHHEPVLAGRPSLLQRAAKWSRRHKPLVSAAAVVAATALIGLVVSTVLIYQEQARTSAALQEATRQRDRAEKNLRLKDAALAKEREAIQRAEDRLRLANRNVRLAWDALEEFYGRVADRWNVRERERRRKKDPHGLYEMEDEPRGADEGDQGLWRRLLRFYESFAKTNRQAPEFRLDVEKAYRRVLPAREKLKEYFPHAIEHRRALGRASSGLAALLHAAGLNDKAGEAYRDAVTTQEEFVNSFPTVREYRTDLAASHRGWAVVLKDIGRHQAAEQHRRAAGELDGEPGATPEPPPKWQIAYPEFSDHTGLNLVGAASVTERRLRLTPAQNGKVGAAWLKKRQCVALGFETTFRFQMSGRPEGGGAGADGFAFVVQDANATARGAPGTPGFQGIRSSLAVEFDPYYWNIGEQVHGQHISVQTDGTAPNRSSPAFSLGILTAPFKLDDNQAHSATIRYVPGTLSIFLDGQADAALAVPVELETMLSLDDGRAWVGFTAATGAINQAHDILDWQFRPLVDPATALPRPKAVPRPPAPPLIGDDEAGKSPGSLRKALRFYEEFAKQEGADPHSRFVLGKAYWRIGQIHEWLEERDEALAAHGRAFELWRSLADDLRGVPEYRPQLTEASRRLAHAYGERGKSEKAIAVLSTIIELDPDDPDTLSSMNNLARVLFRQRKLEEARKLLEKALAARKRVRGREHPDTLRSMSNLAIVLGELGKLEEARKLCEETLAARKRVLGAEHADTLGSMHNLASTLFRQRKLEEARKLDEETLAIRKRVLGPEHPDTLGSMNNLAAVLQGLGKLEEARKLDEETLAIRKRVLGPEHADTLGSMTGLAVVLRGQGKLEEARKLDEEILAIRKRVLGPEDPITLASMHYLAGVLFRQRKLEEARKLLEETLALMTRVLGPEHPDTLRSMHYLASVLQTQGKLDEARRLHEETLAARKRVLGAEDPDTLASMNNLAGVLHGQDKLEEARKLLEETLAIHKRVLRPEHPDTLGLMYNLANVLRDQGKLDEARKLLEERLEARKRVLGPEHPDTVRTARALAWLCSNAARNLCIDVGSSPADRQRAVAFAKRAVELRPDAANDWSSLGVAQYRAGKWQEALEALNKSCELHRRDGTARQGSFLAMAHWQLGHKDEATRRFRRSVEWIRKNDPGNIELASLRDEAAELLGLKDELARQEAARTGRVLRKCTTLWGHAKDVRSVAFAADGKTLATGSFDKTGKLWDLAKGEPTASLEGHGGIVNGVAFTPDGKTLATVSWDRMVRLWDVASGKELATLQGHVEHIPCVAVAPDGRAIASGSFDCTARIWDVADRAEVTTLKGHGKQVECVAFSPDGKTLATGSWDKTVKLWDTATWQEQATLEIGHNTRSVKFSPDGRLLAVSSNATTITVWDAAGRKQLDALTAHGAGVWSLAFSPDGKLLASAGGDKTVKIWDVVGGQVLATLIGHGGNVWTVAFAPDGKTIASGSTDKTVRLWDISGIGKKEESKAP